MLREVWGHGVRLLRKSRGFVVLAVVTLGLGIGAVVAVFQVVDAALLHPLPYPDADRLVVLWGGQKSSPANRTPVPPPDVDDLERSGIFTAMASVDLRQFSFALTGAGKPQQIGAARVSPGIFSLLGVDAAIGRVFTSNDPQAERGTTAVISNHLWKEQYGGDRNIIGRPITLDSTTYTIVGVMPRDFRFPIRYQNEDVEAWMSEAPLTSSSLRGVGLMFVLARLKPGVSVSAASQQLDGFNAQLSAMFPETHRNRIISLVPLTRELAGAHKTELLLLLAAVGIVLLIACTNVANLMLVRGSVHAGETLLRMALGAGRKHIIVQFFSESAALAVLGSLAGLGFSLIGTRLLVTILQVQRGGAGVTNLLSAPALTILSFNGPVFLVAAGVLVLTIFLVGMAPALSFSDVGSVGLVQESKRVSTGLATVRLRSAFLVGQVALSLVLAVGAGLLARSFAGLVNVNPGFRVEHLLTYQFTLPVAKYPDDAVRARFYHRLMDQIQVLPGVESVAAIGGLPLTNWIVMNPFVPEGLSISSPADAPIGNYRAVSPSYFATMGIPIISGQTFSGRDEANARKEAVVNEALARRYFPNGDAVGHSIKVGTDSTKPPYTIVGVVGNIHQSALDQDSGAEFYLSYLESPARSMGVAVRTQVDAATMLPAIQNTVQSIDPDQPIAHIASMTELVQDAARPQRARFMLLGTVTSLALLIAAVGLFALMSYLVSQRRNELGVRMALGARRKRIFWIVMGHSLRLTVIGLGIGIVLALVCARSVAALLFGVSVFDPVAFVAAVVLLLATAAVASAFPALHAARLDPMHALRYE